MATYSTITTLTPIDHPVGSTVIYTVPANSELVINYMAVRAGFGDTCAISDTNSNTVTVITAGQVIGPMQVQPLSATAPAQTYAVLTIPAGWSLNMSNGTISAVLKTYS